MLPCLQLRRLVLAMALAAAVPESVGALQAEPPQDAASSSASARRDDDLSQARALFERNLQAIRDEDREAYLSCYLGSPLLVRAGSEGQERGFDEFAAALDDTWPDRLASRNLQLSWIRPGVVFGSYRYHAVFGGVASHGVSERLFLETPDGWRIGVTTAHPEAPGTPAPALAFVGATALDGLGGELEDATVLVEGGMIRSVGPRETTSVPEGYEVIDVRGRFLTPGLVDTHVHYSQTGWADGRPDAFDVREDFPYAATMAELERHPERFHRAFLRSGITSVLDCGGYPWTRGMAAETTGQAEAPRVSAAGPLLASWVPSQLRLPAQSQFILMQDVQSVTEAVATQVAHGSDVIKVWLVLVDRSLAELAPLVHAAGEAARAHGVPLIVHATQLEAARVAVAAGAQLLVHSVEDQALDEAFVQACLASGVSYCPTLIVSEGYQRLATGEWPEHLRESLGRVSPWVAERVNTPYPTRATSPARRSAAAARREIMAANLLRLAEAGVPVVLGTDAGNPLTLHGPSVVEELQAMSDAGLSASQVLRASTSDAARAIGQSAYGCLARGYVANMLVLEEDPRADVRRLGRPLWVLRNGVLHRSWDL